MIRITKPKRASGRWPRKLRKAAMRRAMQLSGGKLSAPSAAWTEMWRDIYRLYN